MLIMQSCSVSRPRGPVLPPLGATMALSRAPLLLHCCPQLSPSVPGGSSIIPPTMDEFRQGWMETVQGMRSGEPKACPQTKLGLESRAISEIPELIPANLTGTAWAGAWSQDKALP